MRLELAAVLSLGLCACGGGSNVDAGPRPPGTTQADCGQDHVACGEGQRCRAWGTGTDRHWACACTLATATEADSCASNTDGQVHCHITTHRCGPLVDYEACNPGASAPCATGYECLRFEDRQQVDGGAWFGCMLPCQTSADCKDYETACDPMGIVQGLADGGAAYSGSCHANYCGPHTPAPDGGTYPNDFYFGPCNARRVGDGLCLPSLTSDGRDYGLCLAPGSAKKGASCAFNALDGPSCAPGFACVSYGDPALQANCRQPCDAKAPSLNDRCDPGSTCEAFSSSVTSSPDPGVCAP